MKQNLYGECDYINIELLNNSDPIKVIFLDRDGTIHIDKKNTHRIEDLELFEDTINSLKELIDLGFHLVIVSNQDGIRKKIYDVDTMHEFNLFLLNKLKDAGIIIDALYYSPYQKEDNHYSYKPNPGMLLRAKEELNIDMNNSYIIGDSMSDVIAGDKAGVTPILVTTGRRQELYENLNDNVDYKRIKPKVYKNLANCLRFIRNNTNKD